MKDNNHILSLQETEELCQMFLDCRLSVLEERELEYLLSRLEYNSSIIEEVRNLMGIELGIAEEATTIGESKSSRSFFNYKTYISVAASILFIIGIGLHYPSESSQVDSYYIAYADGHRLKGEDAKRQISSELKTADEFVKEMGEMEMHEREMIDNLTSNNTFTE